MIDRILICLDLSDYDKACIAYVKQIINTFDTIKEVELLHNVRYDFLEMVPDFEIKDHKLLKKRIEQDIKSHFSMEFDKLPIDLSINVSSEKNSVDAIRKRIEYNPTTLLVMGAKDKQDGTGILPFKVLASDKYKCPLFLCPKNIVKIEGRILVATDLSIQNIRLFKITQFFANQLSLQEKVLHVAKLPTSYFPYFNAGNEEMKKTLIKKADKKYHDYMGRSEEIQIKEYDIISSSNVSAAIYNYFVSNDQCLLALGRAGRSNLPGFQIGGVIRRYLLEKQIKPVLVV